MKVLFISHNGSLYGANRSLLALIIELKKYNVVPIVYCPKIGDFTEALKVEGIEFYVKTFDNWIYLKKFGFFKFPLILIRNTWFFIRNYREIKNLNADLVYSNSSVATMGILIKFIFKLPLIWHVREFGLKDYNIKFYFGLIGRRYLFNQANALVAISKSIFNSVLNKVKPPTNIIYNGVVSTKYLVEKKGKSVENKPIINFAIVGALAPYKNHQEAILAFADFHKINPKSKLLIIGDTNDEKYRDSLITQVTESQLQESVEFMGYIPDVAQIYHQIDVLLMCSKNEGMGRVTIEAMAHGIPVIGYNGGATPELISVGYNGLLYQDNYKDLAYKMTQLTNTKNLYEEISRNSISEVKAKFTIEAYGKNVLDFINKTVISE